MDYQAIKHFHMSCAGLSLSLFLFRGVLMLRASPLLDQKWARVVPPIIDTFLLGSAITLAVLSAQYPFVAPWLTAKVLALVLYIVLGVRALKHKSKPAFFAALLAAAYIVSVALSKQPLVFA